MMLVMYDNALARIYVLTETLHEALRLSITVGADAMDLAFDTMAASIAPNENPWFN